MITIIILITIVFVLGIPPSPEQSFNITTIFNIIPNEDVSDILIIYFNNNTSCEIAFDVNYSRASYMLFTATEHFAITLLTRPPKVYIIATENVSQYTLILKSLYATWFWNPRAYFIVVSLKSEATSYAKISQKYAIQFLYILTISGTILSYDLFDHGSCGDNINLREVTNQRIFKHKLRLRFNHCPLKILAAKVVPYVIDPYDKTNCGYEVKLIREVAVHADLRPVFINHTYPHWGQSKDKNGSYSFMFKDLYDGKIDLIMGMVVAQSGWFGLEFEGTHMHGLEASHFYVPSAAPIDGWKNFTQIFSTAVWIMLVISGVVTFFVAYLASRISETDTIYKNIKNCIFITYRMCFSPQIAPTHAYFRYIFSLWCITFLLINTAYQSQLVSTLLKPAHEHQIDSVEEVLYFSHLEYGGFDGLVDFFNAAADDIYKDIKKNWINCTLSSACLNRTAKDRDFAVMKTVKTVMYYMQDTLRRPNGEIEVYKLEDYAFVYSICFALRRGSPYLERVNSLLLGLAENGLYNRWVNSIPTLIRKIHSDQLVQLNLHHLKMAFLLLLVGHTIAAIAFTAEIIKDRSMRQRFQFT